MENIFNIPKLIDINVLIHYISKLIGFNTDIFYLLFLLLSLLLLKYKTCKSFYIKHIS